MKIDLQHIKCKDNVMNRADNTFTRSFTSTENPFSDLPALMISFLLARDFLQDEIEQWYMSGKFLLNLKPEVLELPVFCRKEKGG